MLQRAYTESVLRGVIRARLGHLGIKNVFQYKNDLFTPRTVLPDWAIFESSWQQIQLQK